MPQLDPYLIFNGNCEEALRFYEKNLGGKIEMITSGADAPTAAQMPPGSEKKIMHARMSLDGRVLMASDTMGHEPYEPMAGFFLSLSYPDVAEGKRIFAILAAGGKIIMPIDKTFWAEAFGMLVDRYGVSWMINAGEAIPS